MPVRYRRRRVLILSVISFLVIIYLINDRSNNETDDLFEREVKKPEKQVVIESRTTTTTSQLPSRTIREEIVEIDGKKLRKIDWHDYELIARENARTGNYSPQFIAISLSDFSTRIR
jgi:hypothetical protein